MRRLQRSRLRRERLLIASALALCSTTKAADLPACGTGADQVRIQVAVEGLRSARGQVTITLYPDDADRFLAKGGKLARQRVPTSLPATHACFAVPAAGHYAISVYHDEDGDGKFKRSLFGLPAEGYGFSNNPKSLTGLPSLSDVRFVTQPGDNPVAITLHY